MQEQTPTAPSMETEKLIIRIKRGVRHATGDRVRGLGVVINGNSVELIGRCATYHCKQLAQTAAKAIARDKTVRNHVEVW